MAGFLIVMDCEGSMVCWMGVGLLGRVVTGADFLE